MQTIQYPFRNDHEVIIALIEDFNNGVAEQNRRALDTGRDIVEIKKILIEQNANLDKRLTALEEQWAEIDPKAIAKTTKENAQWIRDFSVTKHVAWIIASAAFLLIGWLASNLLAHFRFLPK